MSKFLVLFISIFAINVSLAGEQANALNRCMAASATSQDKTNLARWFIVSVSSHPAMTDIISVSPEKKEELNRAVGLLNSRILGEACAKELKEVVAVEGIASAKASFAVFGELAMQEVMVNPNVVAGLAGTAKYIDIAKINAVINSK